MKKDKKKEEKAVEFEGCENVDKTNNVLKVIIGILSFIVVLASCFGAGYLGVQVGNKEKDNEQTKEDEKKEDKTEETVEDEKLTVDSQVVKDLFEKFREDQSCTYAWLADELETSIEAKRYAAFLQLSESNFSEKTCGSLSDGSVKHDIFMFVCGENNQSDEYAYNKDWDGFHKVIANEKVTVFSASELKSKVQEMFGKNIDYTDNSFSISDGLFAYYDKNNNLYAKFYCYNCGGECGIASEHSLKSVEQDGTTLKLYTTLTEGYEMESSSNDIVYTFELEKETGNYIFVSRLEK